jgi:ABC-type lipoprotein release transport system permease subunit
MTLSLRLAWRNLWRHSRRTWLTATAMIFSNVLLVFLICLQFGSYGMMIENTLKVFSGHLQVQRVGYRDNPKIRSSVPEIRQVAADLRRRMEPARVAARASAFALASSEQRSFGIQVVGVEPEHEPGVSTLPGLVKQGRYLLGSDAPEIVIGAVMARNLKVRLGDELTLLGSGHDGSFAAAVVEVVGIFESGTAELDRGFAEVPLGFFQQTFFMGDHGHSIAIALEILESAPAAKLQIEQTLAADSDLAVLDWNALHPGLKQAIQADLSSAWFMYGVLVILVAFSVLNTQLMSVLERTREFGVITALGIRPGRLASLVMLETTLMASIGFVLGLLLGWLVALYFSVAGFAYPGMDELASRFNLPGRMYPSVTLGSLVLGPSVVFLFSLLASIYPALRLFRIEPVEAMRAA